MAKIELRSILLGESEHNQLVALLEKQNSTEYDNLFEELDSATVMADKDVPDDVVRMHSIVSFRDDASLEVNEIEVVYPAEAGKTRATVSVLAPVGAALIGLREGESITWPLPNGREKSITVLKVMKAWNE